MAGLLPSMSGTACNASISLPGTFRFRVLLSFRNACFGSRGDFRASSCCKSAAGLGPRVRAPPTCKFSANVAGSGSSSSVDAAQDGKDFRKKNPEDTNVVIVGSTGYIGKFVVKEMVSRGYNVVAVAREKSGIGRKSGREQTADALSGARVCFSDVTDASSLESALKATLPSVDVVISCLASRKGGVQDSWFVDYTATKNSLDAGRALGASHFVLLSAICVQKPLLEFQRAKLKFEEELKSDDNLTYTIVRPTAFFKSLGGQIKSVQGGGPYVMFGDGQLSSCKPISEADVARFVADSVSDEEKVNKVLPVGGPGKALTPLEQGQMLFRILGKQPKFIRVPIQIMDFFIGQLDFWKRFFPKLEDAAEFGRIGRYYASESMLVLDPQTGEYDAEATPSYGTDTLEDFFSRMVRDGMAGQELGDQAVF